MKNIKSVLLALLLIVSIGAIAQSNMEDVVYLKNGSSYRGLIVEQILGESIKIQIAGGSVIAFPVADVYKITKEPAMVEKKSLMLVLTMDMRWDLAIIIVKGILPESHT